MFRRLNFKKNKILMVEPGGGLCNRLICLNNAVHILREIDGLELRVVWWKEPECGCRFEDILKPIPGISVINYARPMEARGELLRTGRFGEILIATIQNLFWRYYYRQFNANRIAGYGSGISEDEVLSAIRAFSEGSVIYYRMGVTYRKACILSEEAFSEAVIDKTSSVKGIFGNRGYVGLHIRRTDHKLSIQASPLSFFKEAIEKELCHSKDVLFYLATDDKMVEEELKECYGKKIVVNNTCSRSRKTVESIQDAAVDLIMLANSDKIYGSVGSTFSEMAAEMGRKTLILSKWKDSHSIMEKDNV